MYLLKLMLLVIKYLLMQMMKKLCIVTTCSVHNNQVMSLQLWLGLSKSLLFLIVVIYSQSYSLEQTKTIKDCLCCYSTSVKSAKCHYCHRTAAVTMEFQ